MKKIMILFAILAAGSAKADFGRPGQRPCEATEDALRFQIQQASASRTMDGYVSTAKLYTSMSRRGCPENRQTWKAYSNASLDTARGLNDQVHWKDPQRVRNNNEINTAAFGNRFF
ncbi:MAG: hypothetical protein LBL46_02000 [Rickettsiales bacterium]|jgi:hypothetical protein|nr:hypothetical protein [Rickettsiales bacterium]